MDSTNFRVILRENLIHRGTATKMDVDLLALTGKGCFKAAMHPIRAAVVGD
jgi:hypothetical protein